MDRASINRRQALAFGAGAFAYGVRTARAQGNRKIVVQLATPIPDLSFLNLYVGRELGYFAEEGLEVELRYGSGAPLAAQLAVSGDADIGAMTHEPAFLGYSKGVRGKIFYQTLTHLIYFAAAPAGSAIRTVADLRGKKLGVLGLAGASLIVGRSMLREGGVEPQPDTFLPVGVGDLALSALQAGRVDALFLWEGAYASIGRTGYRFQFIYHPRLAHVGSAGYFSSYSTLQKRADDLARFSRAAARATSFLLANPEEALQLWWRANPEARGKGTDEEAKGRGMTELRSSALVAFDTSKRRDKRWGSIDQAELVQYMETFKADGAIPVVPPVEDISTNEFVDFANNFDVGVATRSMLKAAR
ncbi:ABC transporter substrate-binding protein [Bradyrhizobium tropiciagri]|uniref:ABC transporter substrate-binding protein n=1 Tax=Bradyrhizobium tropiciagri TaxID=312253 RepID=UPI001BA99E8E|nr:ABC transporter substrate-binding protein [Bradyrhizobium tropiciagri]MBR0896740.1 ABC transporter substrate-binding protein [Bradyrhizobium tropiciagri]